MVFDAKLVIGVLAILFLAWISAMYHKRNGYFFWRTFILAVLGLTGLFLLVYKMFLW